MISSDDASLKDYFEKARRWEQDALIRSDRSRKVAWTVAAGACLCAVAAIFAVAALAPLKTVEPFLVRVDNSTGIIDTPSRLRQAGPEDFDDAVRRFYLGRYVTAYEGYSTAELQPNFDVVSAMSSGPVQNDYSQWVSSNNPHSPQTVYGATARTLIKIKSIQLTTDEIATVRYSKIIKQAPQWTQVGESTHWVATINYKIQPKNELSLDEQLINPIRFTVLSYRNDPEAAR